MDWLTGSFLRQLSRREFLSLAASSLAGLIAFPLSSHGMFPGRLLETTGQSITHGRVIDSTIEGYAKPAFTSTLTKSYWQDLVLPITAAVLGDAESGHNRIWYQLNHESYVHSGSVQPVEIRLNTVVTSFPENGLLAEVTVPFTDAYWKAGRLDWHAYRLYYATTYWVYECVQDDEGKNWYRIQDDKWKIRFFVRAEHLHIITAEEISPISPEIPPAEKHLEIHLPEQLVVAYEGDQAVYMARTATGARFRDGDYRTPVGTYMTNRKRPSRHMAAGDLADANSYDLPGVPWVCYLMENGISFHGTYWHNNYGRERSHGCVNLSPRDAQWVYRWTNPHGALEAETIGEKDGTMVKVIDTPLGA